MFEFSVSKGMEKKIKNDKRRFSAQSNFIDVCRLEVTTHSSNSESYSYVM